ncbi:MAG: putative peptide zinc metalloprotease protein [Solirubrobacteraceae bacterium]|nr:putative peptide zinc metalloprotease protein [Solirubrobacteraceae bacterium]
MTPDDDLHVTSPEAAAEALVVPPSGPAPGSGPDSDSDSSGGAQAPPRLADGVELIGEFADSGFRTAPYIARRADGQVVQLPKMLYDLAEQIDGEADYEEIAERFSEAIERRVQAPDAQMLVEEQLRPLGIVAQHDDGESIELSKVDPLLALKFRAAVIPDGAVRSLTTIFRPLFLPPVIVLAVLAMIGLDGWLFLVHGVSQSLRHTLYQPLLMLMLIGGVVLATAWHEIGHATACRYGGAKPGVMGVGIYIVWPAFYTDITDAYRLGKWGRLRTDVGGMYFNVIFALVVGGLYGLTSFEPLLLLIVLQNFAIIQQSLPFLRLDGYYILSDLTGVPDIFLRIRSVLQSFIPGRPADERVTELKSWVRVVVSAYVVLVVLFLLVSVLALVINLPRMVATGYDSAALHFQAVGPDFRRGQALKGILDVVQTLFLALPGAGLLYTGARVGARGASGAVTWSSGHPARQAVLGLGASAGLALAAFSWWPNGEYRPVQPGERGTLTGIVQEVAAIPTGRPSLTAERQRQLHGAPTERQRHQQSKGSHTHLVVPRNDVPATTDTTSAATTPSATTTSTTPAGPAQTTTSPAPAATQTAPSTTAPAATTPAPTPTP